MKYLNASKNIGRTFIFEIRLLLQSKNQTLISFLEEMMFYG